jgi:hydroxyacylglutathione hydrolase
MTHVSTTTKQSESDTMLKLESWTVGPFEENVYLVWCTETQQAMLIDPGGEIERILKFARQKGLTIRYILNTHGHADHIAENALAKEKTGAELLIHEDDLPMLTNPEKNLSLFFELPIVSPDADKLLHDGDTLTLGSLTFSIVHTPGHSPGSICLMHDGLVIAGDTLFYRGVGRTDLPGGSWEMLEHSIREKLYTLPDDTIVYSGHGSQTTIGEERRENPFFRD